MGIRKFGTSDEQRVEVDQEDGQGVRKTAKVEWTDADKEALRRENEK